MPTPPLAEKSLAFPVSEYRRRAVRVQALMAEQGIDVLLATTIATVCYLSGLESVSPHKYWLVAVPRSGDPVILCQDFESHNALLSSWLPPEFQYGLLEDPIAATARLVAKLGATRGVIGVELAIPSSLSAQGYLRLRDALPDATLKDASDCVPQAMAIKSDVEIAAMREAGRITAKAIDATAAALVPGCTDNDLAAAAYASLVSQGSEYPSYPMIVTTGSRSGVPHSTFKRNAIKPGDPVFFEFAAAIHRYQTPILRSAAMGEPSEQHARMSRACTASVNTLIEHIKPGAIARDIAALAQKHVDALPYKLVWHGFFGYSVGLGFPPEWSDRQSLLIRLGADTPLEAGMAFHCSTSLRDIGRVGATCSETVLVTPTGCEVLTEKDAKKREMIRR